MASNKKAVPGLFIKSRAESFWRCGFKFTREGYGIALDALTKEQVDILKKEPALFVEEVEVNVD